MPQEPNNGRASRLADLVGPLLAGEADLVKAPVHLEEEVA